MDKVSIGKKIRAARLRLGLSQAEFAERIGTSAKTLSSLGARCLSRRRNNAEHDSPYRAGMTLNDFTDTPSSETEASPVKGNDFTEAEKQLIEKIRCLRADKKESCICIFWSKGR